MILFSSNIFYFYISIVKIVSSVRIFENMLPKTQPTTPVEFEPKVLAKTCMLKPQKGPCRSNIKMYYYNPDTKRCDSFEWGGCQGNGNRFDTREECQNKCLSKPGSAKSPPKWCSLTFDYGFCFGAIDRWYFDNLWKVCKKTLYSGCGGNRNNFYSQRMCEAVCRFANNPKDYTIRRATDENLNTTLKLAIDNSNQFTKSLEPKSQPTMSIEKPKKDAKLSEVKNLQTTAVGGSRK